MNPAKISRGSSFKGVTAYLMKGSLEAENPERAQWTVTQNLATDNPFLAARLMAASAMDADSIKRANGWKGQGKPTTDKPVLHMSLSWHDSMHPDAQHQQDTARAFLESLGLDKAQALLVGHNDNGKTHLHIVVNVLDPETGKQFSLGNERA